MPLAYQLLVAASLTSLLGCEVPRDARSTRAVIATGDSARAALPVHEAGAVPRNVVLMIGDGMGVTQLSAGIYSNGNYLALERMPYVGLHKSYASDALVTDSAAGATAFSCGEKTYNGAIGVGPDKSPCPTLLESAEAAGMPTGLVATSTITHATPAAFYAHAENRQYHELIATQLAASGVDLFVGGGQKYFDQREEDERDLVAAMRTRGRAVGSYFDGPFAEFAPDPSATAGFFTARDEPVPTAQGRDYLVPATRLALDYLDARDTAAAGFFLMVEGSQIDWGGHANDSEYIISELLDFGEAVDAVLDFAAADGETLVVVTADHETGGYAIQRGSSMGDIVGAFTSDYHTADLIPVFAYGPGAERFAGIYENTAIYDKLLPAVRP